MSEPIDYFEVERLQLEQLSQMQKEAASRLDRLEDIMRDRTGEIEKLWQRNQKLAEMENNFVPGPTIVNIEF
jgi:hypothetical protein